MRLGTSLSKSWTIALLVPFAGLAACDGAATEDDGLDTVTAGIISEGSPEALGILGFLNAVTTTVTTLDVTVGLDARAAKALVAHRDGPDKAFGTADDDRFGSVLEVDSVAYVGTAALDKLLAYCRSNNLIPQPSDVLGTYRDVLFTIDEGTKTLALVNTATLERLDALIDVRAAKNIIAARPIASVLDLSKITYVGTNALKVLKAAALAGPTQPPGATVAAHLATASNGLWHTSESDYPFVVVRIAAPPTGSAALTTANIKSVLASVYMNRPEEPTLAQRDVELVTLDSFFDRYTVAQGWWEDDQRVQAPAFSALRQLLERELTDVKVFRLGRRSGNYLMGAIDVFILGRTSDGEVVGISTISVET